SPPRSACPSSCTWPSSPPGSAGPWPSPWSPMSAWASTWSGWAGSSGACQRTAPSVYARPAPSPTPLRWSAPTAWPAAAWSSPASSPPSPHRSRAPGPSRSRSSPCSARPSWRAERRAARSGSSRFLLRRLGTIAAGHRARSAPSDAGDRRRRPRVRSSSDEPGRPAPHRRDLHGHRRTRVEPRAAGVRAGRPARRRLHGADRLPAALGESAPGNRGARLAGAGCRALQGARRHHSGQHDRVFRHRPRGHLGLPRWRAPGDEALRRRPLALCSGLRLGRSKVRARRGGIGRPRSHLLPQRPSNPAASHGSARSSSAPCWRPPSDGCIVVPAGNGWTATRRALPLDLWRGTEGMQRDLTTFMRGAAIAVALTLAASKAIWAQSQNPSPMVETTRAHERLERVELSGVAGSVPGPEGRDVEIFVPSAFTARTPATLVIHFPGAAWLPERAVAGLGKNAVSAVVDLGGGGTRYDRAFSASHTFQRLVDDITRTVSELAGGTVRVDTVVL